MDFLFNNRGPGSLSISDFQAQYLQQPQQRRPKCGIYTFTILDLFSYINTQNNLIGACLRRWQFGNCASGICFNTQVGPCES